jgi:hypothetical protein
VSVLGIRIGFVAFTAGVAETKIFWLVSVVSGRRTTFIPQADWIKFRLGALKLAFVFLVISFRISV